MKIETKFWKQLFLICIGIFTGTAFCMKWMEKDFIYNGSVFTILELEASYSKEKVTEILSGIDVHVKEILKYHLYFDFAFMAGAYPGIASICMMAKMKMNSLLLRKIMNGLAALQIVAWACDIIENMFLLDWVNNSRVGNGFEIYHLVVFTKWTLALTAAAISIFYYFKTKRSSKTHFLI